MAEAKGQQETSDGRARRRAVLLEGALVLATAAAAIALSLWVTPMQTVEAGGQTVQVGATKPSWSLSGPGELDLFGQRISTTLHFSGPVRPRLRLSRITLTEQLAQLTSRTSAATEHKLQEALVSGWSRYFIWQSVVTGLGALAIAGAVTGWLRRTRKRTLVTIALALVVAEALNLSAIMVTAYTAPAKLRTIRSLQGLVGGAPPPVIANSPRDVDRTPERIAVIGDSTAAGQGLPPVPAANVDDLACHRSSDAYATALAHGAGRRVTNVACGGATIRAGLLGPQIVDGRTEPAQVASAAVRAAQVIVVSIGANDVHWTDLLRLCAVSKSCSNRAEEAYLQQQLAGFSRDYLELLSQLQLLPKRPAVVVNLYFDPFDGGLGCLRSVGMTSEKRTALVADLGALNGILDSGARSAGFTTARPNFDGHGVCADHPYVQGLHDAAPLHPTASGQLAIAIADERALRGAPA